MYIYHIIISGVAAVGGWWTYSGDEELLKKLVYEYGAVVTSLAAAGPWSQYGGGIFAGEIHLSSLVYILNI